MFLFSNQKGNVRGIDTEERLCNHFWRENSINITYSKCVSVAIGIQHAMRLRHNVIWPVSLWYILLRFLINGTFFLKTLLNIEFVFWFSLQLMSLKFLTLRRNEGLVIKSVYRTLYKVLIIHVGFEWNLIFRDRFSKNNQISNFMKIRPLGAKLFYADGRTALTKVTVGFRNFANACQKPDLCQLWKQKPNNDYLNSLF